MGGIYRLFAYLGTMALPAALIMGFRYDPGASSANYLFNIGLYGAFIAVHLMMTRPGFKRVVFGKPEGTSGERRVYITVSTLTWLLVLALHRPVPGPGLVVPEGVAFVALCGVLLGLFAFFEFADFAMMDGFLGVPGTVLSHSQGAETPLMTEGSYASVRHPMYRAAVWMGLASLVMHPNAGQLLWAAMIGLSFVAFIPVEEAQLRAARGDEYHSYIRQTPYRLFRGLW